MADETIVDSIDGRNAFSIDKDAEEECNARTLLDRFANMLGFEHCLVSQHRLDFCLYFNAHMSQVNFKRVGIIDEKSGYCNTLFVESYRDALKKVSKTLFNPKKDSIKLIVCDKKIDDSIAQIWKFELALEGIEL